jgi:hypothetical protein
MLFVTNFRKTVRPLYYANTTNNSNEEQGVKRTYNVTSRRVRLTIFAVSHYQ